MNYYQYNNKRRVPEGRKGSDYIKPFLVLVVFIAIIIAAWKLLGSLFGGSDETVSPESVEAKVKVEIDSGAARVMASEGDEWKALPGDIDIFEQEKLQTLSDGRLSLTFFDGNTARLDDSSTLAVDELTKGTTSSQVGLTLEKGNLWVDLTNGNMTDSEFTVETDTFTVTAPSGSKFALTAPDSLYVLKGQVKADILDGSKVVKTLTVKAAQQLVVTDAVVSNLVKGLNKEVVFELDKTFKASDWYSWNQKKDGGTADEEEVTPSDDETTTDEEEKDPDEEDKENGEGPDTPQITVPGENGDEVTLKKTDQFISGTVSEDTEKVIVNEYTLDQYVPGSGKFTYKASATIKNLKVGSNVFTVTAENKAGDKSKVAKITLILPQKVWDDAGLKDDTVEATSTGDVAITSPNGGKNLVTGETSFVIAGTTPSKAAKVMVNGYQLKAFSLGDTSFKYNANTAVGTLKTGQKNVYNVEAFDEDGKKLGSASITIDTSGTASETPPTDAKPAQSGALSASINLPSTASAYETTLNQITIGGAVTGEPEAVYVNGSKVEGYAPGLEKWSMGVTLVPGLNNFSVYSEKEGQTSATDTIAVTLK